MLPQVIEAALGESKDFFSKRSVDPPLSALGEAQAKALGEHFGAQIEKTAQAGRVSLFCSSMTRAMQTIQPLAERLGLPVQVLPDLVELWGFFMMEDGVMVPKARRLGL